MKYKVGETFYDNRTLKNKLVKLKAIDELDHNYLLEEVNGNEFEDIHYRTNSMKQLQPTFNTMITKSFFDWGF